MFALFLVLFTILRIVKFDLKARGFLTDLFLNSNTKLLLVLSIHLFTGNWWPYILLKVLQQLPLTQLKAATQWPTRENQKLFNASKLSMQFISNRQLSEGEIFTSRVDLNWKLKNYYTEGQIDLLTGSVLEAFT